MPPLAAMVAAGVLFSLYGNQPLDPHWSAYAPLLLMLAYFDPGRRLLLVAVAAALWSDAFFSYQLQQRLAPADDNRLARVVVEIVDLPRVGNGRIGLEVEVLSLRPAVQRRPRRVRLSWYQDEILPRAGERWQFEVKLRQPRSSLNPRAFDYEKWLFLRGVDAVGYIRDSDYNSRLEAAHALNPQHWRSRLAQLIEKNCAGCEQRGLIKALVVGFRGDIDDRQQFLLRTSATAHLLAISGLHVGLAALFGFFLGKCCWRFYLYRSGFRRDQAGAAAAMLCACVYAALAGFSLPTLRALIMLSLVLLALFSRGRINLLQSLSIAAIVILLSDPRAAGSASFWLSLGALAVIALAQFSGVSSGRWWQQLLRLQLYFFVLFAPLGLLIFEQLNPAAYLANLVAIPLVSFFVLPLVLVGSLLLAVFPGPGASLLYIADLLLGLLLDYLRLLLDAGLAATAVSIPAPLAICLLPALACLLLPARLPLRGAVLAVAAAALLWQPARLPRNEFEAVFFDVGQGTAILLRTRNHSLIYDFGPGRPGVYSSAERAALPLLRFYRLDSPDLGIVSHVDQDHSGGLVEFMRHFPSMRLLSGTPRRLRERYRLGHNVESCHDYPGWIWDGVEFRFISGAGASRNSNNASCVLAVSGFHRLLLPGDIESRRELELVAKHGDELRADILLTPHHGSATSSSRVFIEAVRPKFTVHTMGRGNRWGFPDESVNARYTAQATRQLRSDRDGAVRFVSGANGLSVERLRVPSRRIWRRW